MRQEQEERKEKRRHKQTLKETVKHRCKIPLDQNQRLVEIPSEIHQNLSKIHEQSVKMETWGRSGPFLAPCGRHLGAGWVDEGLDVAGLVGCHLLGRRLAKKGPKLIRRVKTIFTHISNGF